MRKFQMAAVQMDSKDDCEENLKVATSFFEEAADRGAKVIAFPETMDYNGLEGAKYADRIPEGKTSSKMAELARKHKMWVLGTVHEKSDNLARPYNTTFVINPQGELVSKYRKLHLSDMHFPGANLESSFMSAGDKLVVCDTGAVGTFGLSICYDMRFCEMYRLLALKGADILFVPSCFYQKTGIDHWETILRTRAIENSCYLVAPAQCGKKYNYTAYGKSMIIDPWGTVLACASERPGLLMAEIDLDYVSVARNHTSTFFNLRNDCYALSELV